MTYADLMSDFAADFLTALRWIVFVLAVPGVIFGFRGFIDFPRFLSVICGFRALAFVISAAALTFETAFLFDGFFHSSFSFRATLSHMFLIVAQVLSLGGLYRFRKIRQARLNGLYEAIEVTGPIAELYRQDPEEARRLAKVARDLTVDALLARDKGSRDGN